MTIAPNGRAGIFRSLQSRQFRIFFLGQSIGQTGKWLQLMAQTLLVLQLTDSAVAVGIVTACQFAPILLIGPWAGASTDRGDKRQLMIATQLVMMLLAFLLGVLVLTGLARAPVVYLIASAVGTTYAFDDPIRRVMMTELVDEGEAANAVGLFSALSSGSRVVGPPLAALLIGGIGMGWCFIAGGLSFVPVLVSLRRLAPGPFQDAERLPRVRGQVREGFRYVWTNFELRLVTLLTAVIATFAHTWQVTLPLLAVKTFNGDEATYALLAMLFSVGALVGALWNARRKFMDGYFLSVAAVWVGGTSAFLAVAPTLETAALASAASGAANMVFLSGAMTVLQVKAVPFMRGRTMALFGVVAIGVTPVGGLISGWIAEEFGTRWSVALGAAVGLGAGLGAVAALKRHQRRELPDERPVPV